MTHIINGDKYRNAPPRVIARILARERETGPDGCWLWAGQTTRDGYPTTSYGSKKTRVVVLYVHRLVYMHVCGDPGDDMQVDHLCHDPSLCFARDDCPHRRCYNPAHLLAVTPEENRRRCGRPLARKPPRTHCDAGHEYTEANTYWRNGARICRKCGSLRNTARKKALRRAARKPCGDCGADMAGMPIRAVYCSECALKRDREKSRRHFRNVRSARLKAETEARRQGQSCATCGADLSDRRTSAVYCSSCKKKRASIAARDRWRLRNWGTTADDGNANRNEAA